MVGKAFRSLLWMTMIVTVITTVAIGQDDPDPNSPSPILVSGKDTARALADDGSGPGGVDIRNSSSRAFEPDRKVVLYVKNLSLLKGEGADAFRVYSIDSNYRQYRFPVIAFEKAPSSKETYAITILTKDEIRPWEPLAADGDVAVFVTWRGLTSNILKLGIGKVGGGIGDISGWSAPRKENNPKTPIIEKNANVQTSDYVGYRWSGDRKRFMEQATFGPTSALDMRVRRIGIRAWLADQFTLPYPSSSNPYPNQPLKPGNPPADCDNNQTVPDVPVTCFADTYTMYQPQIWFFKEAFYGDAQLRHRVAWALSQIWVTSGVDVQQGRHMVEYHKILSRNAFGNYRTLMKEMTLSPTMGGYLDMAISTKNNPNENYAREIKQLFTIGLFKLNPNGTLMLDGSNNPIPTYDQNVVNNLTKVLTGWTFCNNIAFCPNVVAGTVNYIDPLLLNPNNHDVTAKTLLTYDGSTTTNIGACSGCNAAAITTYANNSMDQALDNIFFHPNVGPFVSKLLIQHLVTSDPTPAYVGRVAGVFNNNGFGVRGDMQAVIRAIMLDPEARGDVKTDPNFGKLREPVLFSTNIFRAFDVRSADGAGLSDGYLVGRSEFINMGQNPFRSPTVFNYYPPDNVIPGTTLIGPEFGIMTTGTSIQRANFINRLVYSAPPYPASNILTPNGTSLYFDDLAVLAAADLTGGQLVDELNQRLLHGTMSPLMRSTIMTAITAVPSNTSTDFLNRARQAIYLVATSSQFQVQR